MGAFPNETHVQAARWGRRGGSLLPEGHRGSLRRHDRSRRLALIVAATTRRGPEGTDLSGQERRRRGRDAALPTRAVLLLMMRRRMMRGDRGGRALLMLLLLLLLLMMMLAFAHAPPLPPLQYTVQVPRLDG